MSSLQKFSRQSQTSHSWPSIKLAPPPLACKTRKTAYTGTTSSTRRVTAVRTCPSPMPWWTHRLLPEDTAPDYPKDSITHTFQQVPVPGHVSSRSWPACLTSLLDLGRALALWTWLAVSGLWLTLVIITRPALPFLLRYHGTAPLVGKVVDSACPARPALTLISLLILPCCSLTT